MPESNVGIVVHQLVFVLTPITNLPQTYHVPPPTIVLIHMFES